LALQASARGRDYRPKPPDFPAFRRQTPVADITLDLAAMARLAKVLDFICGADDPCTIAVKQAAASGSEADIRKARKLFMGLKSTHRVAALGMLRE
jgi:hypothetical protein